MIFVSPGSLVASSWSIEQDNFFYYFAQVLEDEKVKEAMAARSIPDFNSGDSLQIKLVCIADLLLFVKSCCVYGMKDYTQI